MQTNLKEFVGRVGELYGKYKASSKHVNYVYPTTAKQHHDILTELHATAPEMAQALAQYDKLVGELVEAVKLQKRLDIVLCNADSFRKHDVHKQADLLADEANRIEARIAAIITTAQAVGYGGRNEK